VTDRPFCFTIGGQAKKGSTVTVGDRDTGPQNAIDKSQVIEHLAEKVASSTTLRTSHFRVGDNQQQIAPHASFTMPCSPPAIAG
jgi:hypothetical protein